MNTEASSWWCRPLHISGWCLSLSFHSAGTTPYWWATQDHKDRRMKQCVLTAAPQSVEGGRRAEAGGSGAAAQTAGTKTLYPAGAHVHKLKTCVKVHKRTNRIFWSRHLATTPVAHRGRGGDGVQSEEVADVHFPEYTVQLGWLIVQETQRGHCGTNIQNTHTYSPRHNLLVQGYSLQL